MTSTQHLLSVADEVLADIERHCFVTLDREVGGILIGHFDASTVVVTASLPALRAAQSSTHVTFTHEVWADVLPTIDRDYPDERIVGWYHTHPGFGLFLSEQDQFAHRNFFSDERMLALVVDPRAAELAWFGWRDGTIVELQRGLTGTRAAGSAGSTGAGERMRRSGRGTAVLVSLAVALAGLGIGYAIAPSSTAKPIVSSPGDTAALVAARDQAIAERDAALRKLAAAQTPAVVKPAAPQPEVVTYRVRAGDTLSALADSFYGDPERASALAAANHIPDPDTLSAGATINIPIASR
jgi:proteasome lid subunit RPN8/RPN11/LysM repeat protein